MNPNALPAELVEKAAIAVQEAQNVPFVGVRQRKIARHVLAAVLPEVRARVLTEVADELESVPDYTGTTYDQGRVDQRHMDALVLHEEAARLRASRLTDTTEETAPTHVGSGVNAEDCLACSAALDPPPYPWICPGPNDSKEPTT